MSEYDLPVPDDAPWLNLSKEEIEDLRKQKYELSEYCKQKLKKLMNHEEMLEIAAEREAANKAALESLGIDYENFGQKPWDEDDLDYQAPNGDYIKNYPLINRVEVITNKGREFVRYGCFNVQVSEQDEGRTLKVFLS